MTVLAVLTYPNIDPVAIEFGPFAVKWYGLAYMAGLLLGWLYIRRLISTPRLWHDDTAPLTLERVDDLLLYITGAVIVGGRLGQVLLYDPSFYFANPAEIIKVWKGGMSFHGALIAAGLLILLFAKQYKVSARSVMDLCCAAVPIGIFFGRIANFINSEHWGRVTDAAVGMVFPNGGPEPRHPSQLYEAALEGLVLFIIMRFADSPAFGPEASRSRYRHLAHLVCDRARNVRVLPRARARAYPEYRSVHRRTGLLSADAVARPLYVVDRAASGRIRKGFCVIVDQALAS